MKKSVLVSLVFLIHSYAANAQQLPPPPQLAATSYLLVDADTGKVLVESNADLRLPPASLVKLMTSYVVSAEVESGRITEADMVPISVKAWRKGGSKMFVREGTQVLLKDLKRGVIIQSGNDASIALAEYVAGSEEAFVDIMNQKAKHLGLESTRYVNSTGWPSEGHYTTARDLAVLARAVIYDYPTHYSLYAEKHFTYNGINQANRNRLLFRDDSVDGLKTGHTKESGYCLVASAKRNGMRLISVVMGTESEEARAFETEKLFTYGFRHFQNLKAYSGSDTLTSGRVWYGKVNKINLGLGDDLRLTIPTGSESDLQTKMHIENSIKAPILVGQTLGRLTIELNGEVLADVPLLAQDAVKRAGFIFRLIDWFRLLFH